MKEIKILIQRTSIGEAIDRCMDFVQSRFNPKSEIRLIDVSDYKKGMDLHGVYNIYNDYPIEGIDFRVITLRYTK